MVVALVVAGLVVTIWITRADRDVVLLVDGAVSGIKLVVLVVVGEVGSGEESVDRI